MAEDKEIEIPEPINKPKDKQTSKVGHPTKIGAQPKSAPITKRNKEKTSRFEPDPIPVEIPSHGYLYKGITNDKDAASGVISIRPMTLREEKILTTDRLVQQGKALDMILDNCIKSDIDPLDLLSSDRLYLLFYLRGMTYGLSYDFSVKCYHCGHNFEQTVEIDKLPIKEWESEEEAAEPFSITLPVSGFTVEAHYMRGSDENKLIDSGRSERNFNQADDSVGESILLLINKVTTDEGEVLSPRDKEDFINNMMAGDADYFRQVMREKESGIQMLDSIFCPRCDGELEFNVPLGRNFFRGNRR